MEAKHAAIRKHVGSSMAYPYGIDEVVLERTISDLEATECEFTTNPLPDKTRKWLNSDQ